MKRQICFVLVLSLMFAGIAEAQMYQSRAETWDFSIMTRYIWSQDISTDGGASVNLSDDLGWGFGFGYNLSESFNLGLEFMWHSIHYTGTATSEGGTATDSYSNVLDTSAFVFTGEYTFGTKKFMPYLSGNLGWVALNTNITSGVDTGCWYYPWYGYVCDDYPTTFGSDEFTYGLGLGLRFQMTPTSFLKVGYEYSWLDVDSYTGSSALRIDLGFGL